VEANARESAQAANNSAAPELLDALEQVFFRIRRWDASTATVTDPNEYDSVLRDGQTLMATLRNLPISLETS